MEYDDLSPGEITFEEKLHDTERSAVFRVLIRGRICVMKVQHAPRPREEYDTHELDTNLLECRAYHRLKACGLCDRGIVPDFYGSMRKFDPAPFHPHLRMFENDEHGYPSALFIQYIPNLESLYLNNFSKQRMDNFISGIREIHEAMVLHVDHHPRNMMVVTDDPERVVWIDFDRAVTHDGGDITERERERLEKEESRIVYLKKALGQDCKRGKLRRAYIFYCR